MTLSRVAPFRAIEISMLARRMAAEGRSILHLEFGQPSAGAPKKAIEAAERAMQHDKMGYWESTPLRARLASEYMQRYGLTIEPERFLITCGASPALVLALSAGFKPGDRIAMACPGYIAYRNTVRALNMEPVEIRCGEAERFQLTAKALEMLEPAPAAVIVASPANPTGTIIEERDLHAIADVCRDRNIQIISDEIYHCLSYTAPCRSMLEYDARAVVVSSFSKYYCMPGWRLGWLLVPPDQIERARAYISSMFLTAPAISQHAGLAAMDCQEELDKHVAAYGKNRKRLLEVLPQLGLTSIAPPDGAFYIYANVEQFTNDSVALCKKLLLETGVAAGPGIDHDPVQGNRFIRFSFAISLEEVEEALRRLVPWFAAQDRIGSESK